MRKYIRTKDGHIVDTSIYKTVVERTFNGKVVAIDLNHWGQDNDKSITWIDVENIIKQADTIEELCDEFVIIDKRAIGILVVSISRATQFNKDNWKKEYFDIYGAIWTDKGLIYVAKLNDKGELEVLEND